MRIRTALAIPFVSILVATSACGPSVATDANALDAVCLDDATQAPAQAWMCGQELTVECSDPNGTPVDHLYVVNDSGPVCADTQLDVNNPGPFSLGDHTIEVTRTTTLGTDLACSATLHVVDTTPPVLTSRGTSLWSPNHKMRRLGTADCVRVEDACDANVEVHFTHATSDEPQDALGDGNHEPDIVLGCDSIELRAERQGGGNGRVYTIGVRAVDASGNESTATCTVAVDHDRSGRAATDDGEVVRVETSGCQ